MRLPGTTFGPTMRSEKDLKLEKCQWEEILVQMIIFKSDLMVGPEVSDREIYSGVELTSWTFQWDLKL